MRGGRERGISGIEHEEISFEKDPSIAHPILGLFLPL
jgi:hypothetical protein